MRLFSIILILCCFTAIIAANRLNSNIDKIISDSYQKYASSPEWVERSISKRLADASESSFVDKAKGHECQHDHISKTLLTPKVNKVNSMLLASVNPDVENVQKRASASFESMRFFIDNSYIDPTSDSDPRACYEPGQIVPFYDNSAQTDTTRECETNDTLSVGLRNTMQDLILPTLTSIFSSFLRVQRTSGNLKLDSTFYREVNECMQDVPIPQEYVSTGVPNADYIIFVTVRPASESTVAYASACNFRVVGSRIDRPLAGILNFNPSYFQQYSGSFSEFDFRAAVKVAVHELTHALGFASNLYRFYIDQDNNNEYSPEIAFSETVSGTSAAGEGYRKTLSKLRAPRALGYARNHFGCSDLNGVELEDFGGAGTAGSHWEKRVAGDELMTGYVNEAMPISGLTLSLFEDMGWYQVDYSQAEYWGWGKGQQCSFVRDRCERSWPSIEGYWCSSSNAPNYCTGDRRAKGSCSITEYEGITPYYQHFSDPNIGGLDAGADACPYYRGDVFCADEDFNTNAQTEIGEQYGATSSCFEVQDSSQNMKLSCYPRVCQSESVLQVNISGQLLACPTNGGELEITSALGSSGQVFINCPPASLLCAKVSPAKADISDLSASSLIAVNSIATLFITLIVSLAFVV